MPNRGPLILCALLALAALLSAGGTRGVDATAPARVPVSPGDLDPTFGTGGKVTTDLLTQANGQAYALVRQPDGKLIAAGYAAVDSGDFAVLRFYSDGRFDDTFGQQGVVSTGFTPGVEAGARAIVLQPDGKIVVAGYSGTGNGADFALARYNPDGSLDPTFGSGGKVSTSIGGQDGAYAIILQPDGKIVVGGTNAYAFGAFTLVRYTPTGALDPTFGTGGIVTTDVIGNQQDAVYGLALQPDGKIVAAGKAGFYFGLARYNPNGSLDPTFEGDGMVTTLFPEGDAWANAVTLQPDGKIVAAGAVHPSSSDDFALARYNPDGSLDPTFDGDGRVVNEFSLNYDSAAAVQLQPDGKIVAAGLITTADDGTQDLTADFGAARYNPDGSLDLSFDGDGWVSTFFRPDTFEFGRGLVIQPDGTLVIAGAIDTHPQQVTFGLLRYLPSGALDPAFGTGGKLQAWANQSAANERARAVALQPDGKIVLAGLLGNVGDGFRLVRYTADGARDPSFGMNGEIQTHFTETGDAAFALLVQPDGKIVAAGHVGYLDRFALARYNPDGSLDPGFGTGGRVTTSIAVGEAGQVRALAWQSDGKLVAAGYSTLGFALVRYQPNGTLDGSFGTGGIVTTRVGGYIDAANAVVIQADEKIVAAGSASSHICNPTCQDNYDIGLARYNPDGTLDLTFDGDGMVTTAFSPTSYDEAHALVLQANGQVVISGVTNGDFALARYNLDGALDPTFGSGGLVATDIVGSDTANTLLLQNNQLIAAGAAQATGGSDFALARYNLDGTLDLGFGSSGKVLTDFSGGGDQAFALAAQPDGRLVAAGFASRGANTDFAAARYLTTAGLPPTLTPTPVPPSTPTPLPTTTPHAGQFEDVPPPHPFYTYVECMGTRGIIAGYPCGGAFEPCVGPANKPYFRPNNSVTRGQVAKIIGSAAGFAEPIPSTQQTFADVPPGSTFYLPIERLAGRSIVGGYPCGGPFEPCQPPLNRPYFRPNNPVTRGQLAKIAASAANDTETPTGQTFQDVSPGSTFWVWIERMASRGVIGGYPCGGAGEPCLPPGNRPYYRPGNPVTRGQTAKIATNTFFPGCQEASPIPTVPPTVTRTPTGIGPTATSTPTEVPATGTPLGSGPRR
jgi:uncharacterized delta-60 repeat protein